MKKHDMWKPLAECTNLLPGDAAARRDRDLAYMMKMTPDNLLRSHYLEAGLIRMNYKPQNIHWGWDAPTSDIRGTLCGHWLSAAAHMYCETHNEELIARANHIVGEIARCQQSNGRGWAFPIPEKYMYWLKELRHPWAPQYVCHKNMMGLLDMYKIVGNAQALEIVKGCAGWFYDFTQDISRERMSDMMDCEETGGLMELWADLYIVTGDERHLTLMRRYERPRLADALLRGDDVLTNMHANATIPEIHGYARAYEATGEEYYRQVVERYWRMAVEQRGAFATGGQTSGEVWTPMGEQAARLGDKTQEHCTVYNMMRLSQYLMRWTGEAKYADYWEKGLYNGIFAQGFCMDEKPQMVGGAIDPGVTTVAYYLPMAPGSMKYWGSEFEDFWCCHCTLLQANATHHESIYYQTGEGIAVAQYMPSKLTLNTEGGAISIEQQFDPMTGGDMMRPEPINAAITKRPRRMQVKMRISAERPTNIPLYLRMPGWLAGQMTVQRNGQVIQPESTERGFFVIRGEWREDILTIKLPKALTCHALPDEPDMVAFLDGPVCLAGLVSEERLLYGDTDNPEGTLLCADDERHWQSWKTGWKTYRQPMGIRFKPLYEICHEAYTVYFPVDKRP